MLRRVEQKNLVRQTVRAITVQNKAPARILLVDDSAVVRRGLRQLLSEEADLEVVAEAEDVAGGLNCIRTMKLDLVLLDLKLRDSNGLDLLRQISGAYGGTPRVLVCSVYEDTLYAERVIRAGAAGYVNKCAPTKCIIEAVRKVLSGKVYVSPEAAEQVLHRLRKLPAAVAEDPIQSLSDREIQVFSMIGEGLNLRDIAAQLHLSKRTVETYRDNIKNKLDLDSSGGVVRRAAQWAMQ